MFLYPYGDTQHINLNWIISELIEMHKALDPDYEPPRFNDVFPYSDTAQFNLNWILAEIKRLKELIPELPEINDLFSQQLKTHEEYVYNMSSPYMSGQGCCSIPDTDKVVFCCVNQNNNDVQITEIDTQNKTVLRTDVLVLGHAQSIFYKDNKLYVAVGSELVGGVTTFVSKIIVIDYSTLSIINTIDYSTELSAIYPAATQISISSYCFDYITDKNYFVVRSVTDNVRICELLLYENNTFKKININDDTMYASAQGGTVFNNIFYWMVPEVYQIVAFNAVTGEKLIVYNVDQFNGYGQRVGELEAICPASTTNIYTDFIIGTGVWFDTTKKSKLYKTYKINTFYGVETDNADIYASFSTSPIQTLYVDYASYTAVQNGTLDNPYSTIFQALDRIKNVGGQNIKIINSVNGTQINRDFDLTNYPGLNVIIEADTAIKVGYIRTGQSMQLTLRNILPTTESPYPADVTLSEPCNMFIEANCDVKISFTNISAIPSANVFNIFVNRSQLMLYINNFASSNYFSINGTVSFIIIDGGKMCRYIPAVSTLKFRGNKLGTRDKFNFGYGINPATINTVIFGFSIEYNSKNYYVAVPLSTTITIHVEIDTNIFFNVDSVDDEMYAYLTDENDNVINATSMTYGSL